MNIEPLVIKLMAIIGVRSAKNNSNMIDADQAEMAFYIAIAAGVIVAIFLVARDIKNKNYKRLKIVGISIFAVTAIMTFLLATR
jgi:ABC-type enterobactin transport system permease subunit